MPDSLYSPSVFAPTDYYHPELYFEMLTDNVDCYLDADPGTPKIGDYIENTVQAITGSSDDVINLLSEFARLGIAPYSIKSTLKQRIGSGRSQTPLTIHRSRGYAGIVPDLPEFYYVGYVWTDPSLATRTHYPPGTPADHWTVFGFEFKTGQYSGHSGAGDYRLAFEIQKTGTGLEYFLHGDTFANNSALTIPGLPVPNIYYWKAYSSYHAPGYPVQLGTWLKLEMYCKRSSSLDDLDTGRVWVAITDMSTLERTKIFDINSSTTFAAPAWKNVHVGCQNLPITRLFIQNPYCGADLPNSAISAGHRMWDRCPFIQA
jgi:hypothetical protein